MGKIPILINTFQMGWNHKPAIASSTRVWYIIDLICERLKIRILCRNRLIFYWEKPHLSASEIRSRKTDKNWQSTKCQGWKVFVWKSSRLYALEMVQQLLCIYRAAFVPPSRSWLSNLFCLGIASWNFCGRIFFWKIGENDFKLMFFFWWVLWCWWFQVAGSKYLPNWKFHLSHLGHKK